MTDVDMNRSALIVSCDSHVGPKLVEHLRPYCPKQYLEAFDDDVAGQRARTTAGAHNLNARMDDQMQRMSPMFDHPNIGRDGHWDPRWRLADMDSDGVAAELIWHFSQNGENLPWIGLGLGNVYAHQLELGSVAYDIYNRWLADFCSTDPERLLGLVYIPSWDIDASIRTLRWARERGLRCVNFPAPGRPCVKEYNHWDWDPFWSTCTDLGFTLSTHSSGGPHFDFFGGPGGMQIVAYEGGSFMSRRAVWILTYGEVFQRHPELKLVITEQVEGWYAPTMRELDSFYMSFGMDADLDRLPSEYMRSNVYLGASFISPWQAEDAVAEGYVDNVLWGRDYPHIEGVFQATVGPDEEPMTKLALRHVFHRIPTTDALKILGTNAVRVFGLDAGYLRAVADRIGASTPAQLTVAPVSLPDNDGHGFMGQAGPRPLEPERVERGEKRRAMLMQT
jgi:predicted TIM-barrel fold metal-dependent hydrolase